MAIIGFIVFGLVVGFVARLLVPGRQSFGLVRTLIIGVAGSVVGGVIATALGTGEWDELDFVGSIVAFAVAIVLVVLGETFGFGKDTAGRD